MLPDVVAGDPTALRVFLAESLKAEATGKGTSTQEMTDTGVWSERDLEDSSVERGRRTAEGLRGRRRRLHRALEGAATAGGVAGPMSAPPAP